jgi:hypothetical protein
LKILDENLIFKDYLSLDFRKILEKKDDFLKDLDLDKKEKYR